MDSQELLIDKYTYDNPVVQYVRNSRASSYSHNDRCNCSYCDDYSEFYGEDEDDYAT